MRRKDSAMVKSGDRVVFTMGREAHAVGLAIAGRKEELTEVHIFVPTPGYDFGWYDEGWQDSFNVTIIMPTGTSQEAVDSKRCDIFPNSAVSMYRAETLLIPADVVLTEVSPTDEKGFCSFGQSLWNKKANQGRQNSNRRGEQKPDKDLRTELCPSFRDRLLCGALNFWG